MSRWNAKEMPRAGSIVSSIWTYVVVSIGQDAPDKFHVFESSKHQKLEDAQEQAAAWDKSEFERRRQYDPDYVFQRKHVVAEWKQVDGKCVLVLMEDPQLAPYEP